MMNETLDEKRDSLFEDYDDFEKLLMDFVNDGFEKVEEDVSEETTEDDEELLDDEPEEDVDEDVNDDEEGTPTVTDGEINQNDTHSVKVQILNPIKNARKELDRLVGCRDIKRRMDELLSLTRYNNMKREMCPDSKQHEVSLHSVFFGRPGTGKTTVCKIFGSLLHDVGALSKGHVVVCDRSTFIGTLWGDEERAMRQVVDMARGGVLMLQEAYAQRDPMTWGNARFIANQLDRIYLQHARRCVSHSKKMDRQHLQTLTPADITPMEVQKRRPHVGF